MAKNENEIIEQTSDESNKKTSQIKKMSGETQEISTIGVTRFRTDLKRGLTDEQVQTRIEEGLVNDTGNGSTKTILQIILSNVLTVFNMITFAVAAWLISVGAVKDLFFMVIVSANIIIGIIQEIRAKKTIDKLSLLSAPTAVVIRNGRQLEIPVNEIVLDDLLVLSAGKQVCADCILKEGGVEVNESLLTGESDALVKKVGSSLFSGSFVVSGNCKAKVEKIGADSYVEKLAKQAKVYKKPKSKILDSLKKIIRTVIVLLVPIAICLFLIHQEHFREEVLNGSSYEIYKLTVKRTAALIIAMIPSGLFLTTSVALAVSVVKLARNNTLVQELYCIEMLARVDVLCLDKTGTITDGTMTVKGIEEINNQSGLTVKQIIALMLGSLNDGNMTSVALEKEFGKAKRANPQFVVPFSSARKFSAVTLDKYGTFFLGAPEFILKKEYDLVKPSVDKYARRGYRVLLIGHNKGALTSQDDVTKLKPEPLALILIEDTIRPDAIETIEYFKNSGVDVKVISGDNPLTVSMVAKRAGIEKSEKYISLDRVSDDKLYEIADQYTVFGRVTPNQKKILVEALKSKGKTVAMTGDGVNDILALKEADCSIAMASGSEAARNVSHLVLLDSNFSSMPKVVQEGRRVINNIQRVATLFLTKTIFSFLLAMTIIFSSYVLKVNMAFPIELNQLMIIDFLAVGIPAFFLALESNNNMIKGNFLWNVLKKALPGALVVVIDCITIFCFRNSLSISTEAISTMSIIVAAFTCLMVLYRTCTPFNLFRRVLFGSMFMAYLCCIFITPVANALNLVSLDVPQILLVLLLIVLTDSLLNFFIKLPATISSSVIEKLRFKQIRIVLVEKEKKTN